MNRGVSFSHEPAIRSKHAGPKTEVGGNKKRATLKIWIFKIPKGARFSTAGLLRKVVGALPFLATQTQRRCSRKVSSASLARSCSYAETLDSHRAEAIEDCIEFLNSSSLQRSNSVAALARNQVLNI